MIVVEALILTAVPVLAACAYLGVLAALSGVGWLKITTFAVAGLPLAFEVRSGADKFWMVCMIAWGAALFLASVNPYSRRSPSYSFSVGATAVAALCLAAASQPLGPHRSVNRAALAARDLTAPRRRLFEADRVRGSFGDARPGNDFGSRPGKRTNRHDPGDIGKAAEASLISGHGDDALAKAHRPTPTVGDDV